MYQSLIPLKEEFETGRFVGESLFEAVGGVDRAVEGVMGVQQILRHRVGVVEVGQGRARVRAPRVEHGLGRRFNGLFWEGRIFQRGPGGGGVEKGFPYGEDGRLVVPPRGGGDIR